MTIDRMADKESRSRVVIKPDWKFLGIVNCAYMISAMMMRHPEANPSPRLANTEEKNCYESRQVKLLLTNIPVLNILLFWGILELPHCEAHLIVSQSSLCGSIMQGFELLY